jgi:hypothetical protein
MSTVSPSRQRMIEDVNARKLRAGRRGAKFRAARGSLRFASGLFFWFFHTVGCQCFHLV